MKVLEFEGEFDEEDEEQEIKESPEENISKNPLKDKISSIKYFLPFFNL